MCACHSIPDAGYKAVLVGDVLLAHFSVMEHFKMI